MNKDTRLSDMLHVLLHMAHAGAPLTSDTLARSLETNPAILRRTMAGLREAGVVCSTKGHGGGWELARPLNQITLLTVYEALGRPTLFAIGNRNDHPACMVQKNVNAVMASAIREAEALLAQRFGSITLDEIAPDRDPGIAMHMPPD